MLKHFLFIKKQATCCFATTSFICGLYSCNTVSYDLNHMKEVGDKTTEVKPKVNENTIIHSSEQETINEERALSQMQLSFIESSPKVDQINSIPRDISDWQNMISTKMLGMENAMYEMHKHYNQQIKLLSAENRELKNELCDVHKELRARDLYLEKERQKVPSLFIDKPIIQFVKNHVDAKEPNCAHIGDQCDLYSISDVVFQPGESIAVDTGLNLSLPPVNKDENIFYFWQSHSKSSLSTKGLITQSTGTWDNGFQGEVKFLMRNISNEVIEIKKGQKFAQMQLCIGTNAEFRCANPVDEKNNHIIVEKKIAHQFFETRTSRGPKGLGSTGQF